MHALSPGRISAISLFLIVVSSSFAAQPPHIFWASDPVRPDETVMVHGSNLGAAAAIVEIARVDDSPATAPVPLAPIQQWTRVPVLQGSPDTLKFVVPAAFKLGVFAFRITADGATTDPTLLNAPDPWWIQGDEGENSTPGGWMRILGKSLSVFDRCAAILRDENGKTITLRATTEDGDWVHFQMPMPKAAGDEYSPRFRLPADIPLGRYSVQVHNGAGGNAGWRPAGKLNVESPRNVPKDIFSVLETYGPDAINEMRQKSLVKYNQPIDRTEGILAALKKAKDNGGGTVYFPAGRYTVKGTLNIPPHTILKGEGEGLVTLWWGTGHFNLDGGGPQGRAKVEEPNPPSPLIEGRDFELRDLSLYLPLDYEQAIVAGDRLRMDHVRIRIDHYWLVQGRGNGAVARLGNNFAVTDCDILCKGDGLIPGQFGVISHNHILSNKSNTPMGGSKCVIVEDNQFDSMDPTAYQNIAGSGRNIYYGHNHQQALYGAQSDYSFTFDAGGGAYLGGIAKADGTQITLAADPTYPKWAQESSSLWKRSALFILDGKGVGQWRDVISNHGRSWEIDRPLDVAPDATSVASIVPFNGRVLVIGNHFEDANWVNVGYGTSIDVICAENQLNRCADMMNYGLRYQGFFEPSWHVQYFDNTISEGVTKVGSNGDGHKDEAYTGPLTRWAIHRRQTLTADNSGSIAIGGNIHDAIVEGCTLNHALSTLRVDAAAVGVVVRNNTFVGATKPRYEGDGIKTAVVEPAGR